jgi:molecular chaperone GrpE
MTKNTSADHDFDEELEKLAASLAADAPDPAPTDVVDAEFVEPVDFAEPVVKDAEELLAERTLDLQRLQAEYINYKRRVDRDRDMARQRGIDAVLTDLLPVLDGIEAARAHGELTAGAVMLADEVEKLATKYGLTAFGEPDEPFNPHVHDALMYIDKPGYPVDTVAQVFQKGYQLGDRVVRPARVGVAAADPASPVDPTPPAEPDDPAQS